MDKVVPSKKRRRLRTLASLTDWLSQLPDHIIHHEIFSRLGANDIGRLMAVSRRFAVLALSSPYLYFKVHSGKIHSFKHKCGSNCERFMNFLQKIITSRPVGFPLLTLRIQWSCDAYQSTMDSLLNYAGQYYPGLEKLHIDLNINLGKCDKQIACSLGISHWFMYEMKSVLPTFPKFTSLQVLVLKNCYFSGESQNHFSSCVEHATSLKYLALSHCSTHQGLNLKSSSLELIRCSRMMADNITISCSLLQRLEIEDSSFDAGSEWIIDGPILKQLILKDCSCYGYGKIIIRAANCGQLLDLAFFGPAPRKEVRSHIAVKVRAPNLQKFRWTVENCKVDIINLKDQTSYEWIREMVWDSVRNTLKATCRNLVLDDYSINREQEEIDTLIYMEREEHRNLCIAAACLRKGFHYVTGLGWIMSRAEPELGVARLGSWIILGSSAQACRALNCKFGSAHKNFM